MGGRQTAEAEKKAVVNEVVAIFAEVEIDGIKIKPWTLKQGVQLTSILAEIVKSLQDRGINLADLSREVDLKFIASLIEGIAPELPVLISVTLRRELKEVEEMDLGQAIAIGIQIFVLNWNQLKNYFGQIWRMVETLKMTNPKLTPSPSQQQ